MTRQRFKEGANTQQGDENMEVRNKLKSGDHGAKRRHNTYHNKLICV